MNPPKVNKVNKIPRLKHYPKRINLHIEFVGSEAGEADFSPDTLQLQGFGNLPG